MNHKQPVILQVLPSLRSGGVERGTIEIARAIAQAGGKSLVASSGGPMVSQVGQAGGLHITLPLSSKNPFTIWLNAQRLAWIIRKHNVNIIHARSRAPAWSAWLAAKQTGCKFVTTFHGAYGLQNKWKQRYNSVMARGDRVIAISHFIADYITKNYEMDADKLRIIHRGVDLQLFKPQTHSPQRMIDLAHDWRLPDALPLILFPGRLSSGKGHEWFVKALGQLPHRHFFAIILGDDKDHSNYREKIEQLIIDCNLLGHVRIAGHTHNITEAYMLSKLVVATSVVLEAFGRVVLEAQAMGKPVITTNHGGPQEIVVDGETGLLVPVNDVEALSKAIDYVLSMPEDLQQQVARDSIANAQHYSLEKMCQKTIAVYQELI